MNIRYFRWLRLMILGFLLITFSQSGTSNSAETESFTPEDKKVDKREAKKENIKNNDAKLDKGISQSESNDLSKKDSKNNSKNKLKILLLSDENRNDLHLDPFYYKAIYLEGLWVLASKKVSDEGLIEAAYLINKMLEKRTDILRSMGKQKVHFVVMAPTEMTTDVPEQRQMKPKDYWDKRARGLGGIVTSCGEENLLNLRGDRYYNENILIHEFGHAIHMLGIGKIDKSFDDKLQSIYKQAKERGLWKNTYALTNHFEYWAEGVQSYFDCNAPPGAVHNDIDTREKLKKYDVKLFELIDNTFKQNPYRYVRHDVRQKKVNPENNSTKGVTSKSSVSLNQPLPKFTWTKEGLQKVLEKNKAKKNKGNLDSNQIYMMKIEPHWYHHNQRFWYHRTAPDNNHGFLMVDALTAERRPLFDHNQLAEKLTKLTGTTVISRHLPFTDLTLEETDQESAIRFQIKDKSYRYDLISNECRVMDPKQKSEKNSSAKTDKQSGDRPKEQEKNIKKQKPQINPESAIWDFLEDYSFHDAPAPEDSSNLNDWLKNSAGSDMEGGDMEESETVGNDSNEPSPYPMQKKDNNSKSKEKKDRKSRRNRGFSPDKKWSIASRDYNLFLKDETTGKETQLTKNGEESHDYRLVFQGWSPDSTHVVAARFRPGSNLEVYRIESSPKGTGTAKGGGTGRAILRSDVYPLPGDRLDEFELHLFETKTGKEIPLHLDVIDWGYPQLHWDKMGKHFYYRKVDRGHQRFRVMAVTVADGKSRTIVDEKSNTFINTNYVDDRKLQLTTWLENGKEMIYVSEKSGWKHLYLVNLEEGKITNAITQGDFVVRGIEWIDEKERKLCVIASGRETHQDPYLLHYYTVRFDGSQFTPLTPGDGNHIVQFSPDRHWLIDTYSRVDMPPVHELRNAITGDLVKALDQADISEVAHRLDLPEVFHTLGRDGKTTIWGIIQRPHHFDPGKQYPVIEYIYAGPHDSHVPKGFATFNRFSNLTDLGFIVVQIDGMGTRNRSKAFHDVCWHNLKDAGFPDRILWHKAVAQKYPQCDISRVGIYGTSAGGQNSTGALLFFGDFYKAAVSSCGCHDNRMDKAYWNEQWMGYPVGPAYAASSNIDHATNLRGHLMLIVGELDTNVPPESTFRLVDALIKARKMFDLVVIPGMGHSDGGPYGRRRLQDFFLYHLHGIQAPFWNSSTEN